MKMPGIYVLVNYLVRIWHNIKSMRPEIDAGGSFVGRTILIAGV